jgi:hypothetical protein
MRKMRFTDMSRQLVLSFLVLAWALPDAFSQEAPVVDSRNVPVPASLLDTISVDFNQVPLREALHAIADKGRFTLNYNENILDRNALITFSGQSQPAFLVLRSILRGTQIEIIVLGTQQVILFRRKAPSQGETGKKYTISGYVTDAATGEALVGANVTVRDLATGASANTYGFYSITLAGGEYLIQYSYMGYATSVSFVALDSDTKNDAHLQSRSIEVDTVLVLSDGTELSPGTTAMGTVHLDPEKLAAIPVLFGEQDLLKVIQFLPGVSNPREGDCGIYVRGGDADQNLILLDEATIYSPFHTFGLFSVFNSDAIKNIRLVKGAAPAKFGGRLSSVIDMQMKEGNMKEFDGVAGIGLIFSRVTVEGPILKDKASFLISGRRTYLDLLAKTFGASQNLKFHFYDLNAKINYKVDENDRVYLSGYFGRDGMGFSDAFDMTWGNTTGTIRWNHLFSDRLFLNSSFIVSDFTYQLNVGAEEADDDRVQWLSEVTNITLKEDFEYFYSGQNILGFGVNYIHHSFLPADFTVTGNEKFRLTIGEKSADEFNAYVSHEHAVSDKLKLEYGLRASLFTVAGEADRFNLDEINELDVDFHGADEKTYANIQPRFSAVYLLDESSSLKAGFSRNYQYLHMLSNSNSGTPLDVWQPSSSTIKPQIADQFSLGYFRNLQGTAYELSTEIYYKYLQNQIDYKEGANFILKNYFDSELVFGKGWAYGFEVLLKKNTGSLTGWIAYTLSVSEREFERISNGNPFPAKNDKPHEFNIVAQYKPDKNWSFSSNFVYASGYTTTLPYGKYSVFNQEVMSYTVRNGYRLPPYHRLDFGVSYTTSRGGVWSLSFYNLYGRRNIYTVLIRDRNDGSGLKEAVKFSLFPMIPSLSYTFTF